MTGEGGLIESEAVVKELSPEDIWATKTLPFFKKVYQETRSPETNPQEKFKNVLRAYNLAYERGNYLAEEGRWEEYEDIEDYWLSYFYDILSISFNIDIGGGSTEFSGAAKRPGELSYASALETIKNHPEIEEEMLVFLHRRIAFTMESNLSPHDTQEVILYNMLKGVKLDREITPVLAQLYIEIEQMINIDYSLGQVLKIETGTEEELRENQVWLLGYMRARGYPQTLDELRQLAAENKNGLGDYYDQLQRSYLPKEVSKVYHSLMEIYDDINFENYPLNQELLNFENGLLERFLKGKGPVLDIACGTGRLLEALRKKGLEVSGFDLSEKNLATCVKRLTAAGVEKAASLVKKADWFNPDYPEESFAAAYCLGRSFCHLRTVEEWLRFFDRQRDYLEDGATLVIDIPDITKGSYAENVAQVKKRLEAFGLNEAIENLIFDGPDDRAFDLRSSPSREQMYALAELMGFKVKEVIERPFGKNGDVNLYWVLEKGEVRELSEERASELLHQIEYFTRANNPYRKFNAWYGMTPCQLVLYGKVVMASRLPRIALARDPRTNSIEFFEALSK